MKVVVFACNLYADVAPAFHHLWYKLWPDCPHELTYVTNTLRLDVPPAFAVHYYPAGEMRYGWRLRKFIEEECNSKDLLLLMMIDYLVKTVNVSLVERARRLCRKDKEVVHVRLNSRPHAQLDYPAKGFREIEKRTRYSLSLQPGIWQAGIIHNLVRDENPFQTEVRGSRRTHRVKGKLLCTEQAAILHVNYYRKGNVIGRDMEWVKMNVPEGAWPRKARG